MQSGLAIKSNGGPAPPNRLRLHIVEMAEKRSRNGSGNKLTRAFTVTGNFDQTRHIGPSLAQLKDVEKHSHDEVYECTALANPVRRKENLNLDLPQQTQEQPRLQRQKLNYHRVVVLDDAGHNCQRERASAWLLKRFKQRSLGHGAEASVNPSPKEPEKAIHNERISSSRVVEPTKRYRAVSGRVIEKQEAHDGLDRKEKELLSKTPEEAETVSLAPTSHFPSNGSADTKKNRQSEVKHGTADKEKPIDTRATEEKNGSREAVLNRGKEKNPSRLYELKGNALETPPPRQSSARKPGIFSASLEAFRRRLRLTANKYSDRLNNDNLDRTEEYLIRPEPQNGPRRLVPHPPQRPRQKVLTPNLPRTNLSNQRPSSGANKVDLQNSQPSSHSLGNKNNTIQSNYNYNSIHTIAEIEENNKGEDNKGSAVRRSSTHYANTLIKNHFDQGRQSTAKERCVNKEDKNADLDSQALPYVTNTKPPMANVKTYVVMNNPAKNWNQPPSTPAGPPRRVAPLTEHNLRLHDSLQAMFERRARRMARFQKRQIQQTVNQQQQEEDQDHGKHPQQQAKLQQQQPTRYQHQMAAQHQDQNHAAHHRYENENYDSDSSEESANSNRIRRWVVEATQQSTLENLQAETIETLLQPLAVLSHPELAVGSAIQFGQALDTQRLACC